MSLSPNHGDRGDIRPDLIVLHYTGMKNGALARARLCDPASEVSAHWLIHEHGLTEALVPETRRAWHAGAGEWLGRGDVNARSVGVELVNTGTQPFPEPQMAALEALLPRIMARWGIKAAGVIAHSDMAPTRKTDPGPRFDWRRLGLQGMALWPDGPGADLALHDSLSRIGYPWGPATLAAFRLRFRPWATGPEDAQDRRVAAAVAYSCA